MKRAASTPGRCILLVMDSVGIGAAPDAGRYGDDGADTLGHIVAATPTLALSNLAALGLGEAANEARGQALPHGIGQTAETAAWAHALPQGAPKGSTGGHWEIAGVPVERDWGYFGEDPDAPYPSALLDTLIAEAGLPGLIVVGRASGTAVIAEHGAAHCDTGRPIVYTSADSVLQIAAHERHFGLERLYGVCEIARRLCDDHRIARVIARPFVGAGPADFQRTDNRRDFAIPPSAPTLLDALRDHGIRVTTFGKIGDLFAHRGIDTQYPATGLNAVFDNLEGALAGGHGSGLFFANFCDFDSKYGHRCDVAGYADELARFDRRLGTFIHELSPADLLIVTADHGNDPTAPGSDHTRETVPVLLRGPGVVPGSHGRRASFCDIGATAAAFFGLTGLRGQPID